jgi:DNA-binding NarL/FixJ family response regulator
MLHLVGLRRSGVTDTSARPRVLLVDDHPHVLKSVSRLLSAHFDVAAVATDGHEALDAAARVDPDIIVMDVTMPGLNGFETAREFRRRATRSPIVFMTVHEREEFVAEGFRSGGRGYVLKTKIHTDLVNAIHCVLAGQLFMPSLTSLFVVADGRGGHAARFLNDEENMAEAAEDLLDMALRRGDAVAVISAPPILGELAARLQVHGWNVDQSTGLGGRYRGIPTDDAIRSIMRDGRPHPDSIAEIVADLERTRLATAGPDSRLTLVGDIAAQFILDGTPELAVELEHHWDQLTRGLPILTVCCYPMTCFTDGREELLQQLCIQHSAVA